MKHLINLSLVFVLSTSAMAQTFDFRPLSAQGSIPEDFSKNYYAKMQAEIDRIGNLKSTERSEEVEFHQMNEFLVDAFMTSGKVIYGDEITDYLNKVLDKLLANHKSLRNEIRVYAVRDAEFNAYTTNNGIIFVNMGLLAELATEAQLAYVLAHEVVHYAENHVRKDHKYKKEAIKQSGTLARNSVDIDERYYAFSKEHEIEADEKGYKDYFEQSGYSKVAPFELMDIMLYSYLPFDEVEFDVDFLNSKHFGIASKELRDFEALPISAREDVSDSLSSHPNIKKRTEALSNFLKKKKEGSDFLVSEQEFIYVRNLARYESLDDFLRTAKFDRAIYQAFLLMQQYPDDDYLKRAVAFAIYGTSVYKNYGQLPPHVHRMIGTEGELSRVRYILKKVDAESLNILAVAKTYEYYNAHPDDLLAKRIYQDALWELTHYHGKTLSFFKEIPTIETVAEGDTTSQEEEEVEMATTGKVKRLKENKKEIEEDIFSSKYAFSSYLEDSAFTNYFSKLVKAVEIFNEKELPRLATSQNKKGKEQTLKDVRNRKKMPAGHYYVYPNKKENIGGKGIKSALVITPESYTLHAGFKGLDYQNSVESLDTYVKDLQTTASNLKIKLEIFDYKYVDDFDSEKFNDMQLLQMWYEERNLHKNVDMVTYMFDRVNPLCAKYNTNHLLYTGTVSIKTMGLSEFKDASKKTNSGYAKLATAFILPPSAPFIIGASVIPTFNTYQFIRVIDMQTDKVVYYNSYETKQLRNRSTTKALTYNQLNEMSAKPKYKSKK